jgi:PAS domain S-box-containing protein
LETRDITREQPSGRSADGGFAFERTFGAIGDLIASAVAGRRSSDEHRRTAAALRDSQDTVQALLDATTETALLIDTQGRIITLNEVAYQRLKGLASFEVGPQPEDLIGRCVFDFFPEDLRATRKARNDEVIASARPARFEDERNGRWMDNSIYPITDPQGRVLRLAVYSYDITDRKNTERELARALQAERERARRDALTGVLNHGAIVEELQGLLEVPAKDRTHVVAVVDVDGLKSVNDTHGHRVGDAVLVAVAGCPQGGRSRRG